MNMSEPIQIQLNKTSDYDGASIIALTRDNLVVVGGRQYTGTVSGPGGLIRGDFFGLFGGSTLKLVGVAGPSNNPQDVVRVLDSGQRIREQVPLTPGFKFVLMSPGDSLAVRTQDGDLSGGVNITLQINELTEADHIALALRKPFVTAQRRFRIIRTIGSPFVNTPLAVNWSPNFIYEPVTNLLVARDNNNGPIPITALTLGQPNQAAFVSIRYGNPLAAGGNFFSVEGAGRTARAIDTLLTVAKWSQVARFAYDDLISLDCAENAVGGVLTVDIDVIDIVGEERVAEHAAFKRAFT
jgi:hypothetical protein